MAQIAFDYRLTANALDEAELFIGGLVARHRGKKRRAMLTAANVEISQLLDDLRLEIGPDQPAQASPEDWLAALTNAYAAWQVSSSALEGIGACSFNMVAFEAIMRCTEKLE